ncbi:division/cell wall cluster transcriptional repressor MraZ [Metamycoplasma subdolum]|uniref:Transcriptional regulator MraZ n=1 Tax=Metamycoplasma subdolum TaxID=92407 RepID=A0A3L9ZXU4_9BACT|nr:division/cell wall cluster transcriptional repressor MraZ [Metamycoplasma subdolum]RMA77533.1 division/cell wall cluster transcriptional repressor MraZ [Metamycoplasma subdolum]WPB50726.1 division/cell wall cluster transcriptional repressor MraZ [Metamycoplasma subdolum]
MFGKYDRQIDPKNRVVIPTKFLKELGETFFITLGFDKSLIFRSEAEFEKLKQKLEENNSLNKDIRNLTRFIFANTIDMQADRLGRVTLPKHLLEKATIKKEIVFIGTGSVCELFAKEVYEKEESVYEDSDKVDELVEKLYKQGVKL